MSSHIKDCIIIFCLRISSKIFFSFFVNISSGSFPCFKTEKNILFFSFIKGNNLSAILKAACCPLLSPSKQIIGFEKNLQIKLI